MKKKPTKPEDQEWKPAEGKTGQHSPSPDWSGVQALLGMGQNQSGSRDQGPPKGREQGA